MAVFRVEKTKDFTIMCNHHLRNMKLSLKSKGLRSFILPMPKMRAVQNDEGNGTGKL